VQDALAAWSRRAGLVLRQHVVRTLPTASLRERAARLLEEMARVQAAEPGPAHIVGHSSGGLDARLVVTPAVSLPGGIEPEPLAARVRSVVTLATPHHGTPLAAFFSSLLGQQLLEVLSIATSYVLRTGRLPGDVLARLTAFFMRLALSRQPASSQSVRRLHDRLLEDFDPERRGSLEGFVELIARDQDLLPQITPAAIDVFNASTEDRPGVRYGCVVTQAAGASLRSFLSAGFSPYAHASHALFVCVGQLAARVPRGRVPALSPAQRMALGRAYGAEPGLRAHDGIVPTLSQAWGDVIRGVWADHFDVIGHFNQPTHVPPHFDWLASGSGFGRRQFIETWDAVAAFMFRE
jgi:hypothetical protein